MQQGGLTAKGKTFLAELIYQGKKLYLKDLWVPSAEDSIKIGYTKAELQWAHDNAFTFGSTS